MSLEPGDFKNYSNQDVASAIIAFDKDIPWTDRFERLMHEWSACQRPKSYWRNFVSYLINNNNDEHINKYLTTINSSFLKNCEDIYRLCVDMSNQTSHDNVLLEQIDRSDILKSLKFDGNNIIIDYERIRMAILTKFPYATRFQTNQMSLRFQSLMQNEYNHVLSIMQNDFPHAAQPVIKDIAFNTLLLDCQSPTPPPTSPTSSFTSSPTSSSASSLTSTSGVYNYYTTDNTSKTDSWSQQSYQTNNNNNYYYYNTNPQ